MFCGDIWINNGDKRSQWVNWRPVVIWSSLTLVKEFFLGGGFLFLLKWMVSNSHVALAVNYSTLTNPFRLFSWKRWRIPSWVQPFWVAPSLFCIAMVGPHEHEVLSKSVLLITLDLQEEERSTFVPHEALTSTANLNQIEKCNKTDLSWGKLHMWHEIISGCEKPVSVSLTHWIRYLDLTKPRIYLHWLST